jgi:hypothetical protein
MEFPTPRRKFRQPQWDGGDLAGRTIHLHAEQGFGDTIQFIRYVVPVAQRGGRIVVECQPELKRLVQMMPSVSHVVTTGEPLVDFDVHCPLLSLPLAFGTTLESIPSQVPYLQAGAEDVSKWSRRMAGGASPLKVGLAWSGNKLNRNNHNRSLALGALAALAAVQETTFYSLQKGEAAHEARNPPAGLDLVDWTDDLHDFADTAGLIANLDLVISVDTAIVHLAGAMGKPVWVLLPFAPDCRWLLEREDSPWYPTMRLFRQTSPGDWASVARRVTEALQSRLRCGL